MTKSELAEQLRQRQRDYGRMPREQIDATPDDRMIDSYITCHCCGDKQVMEPLLSDLIRQAQSAEHFFTLCDKAAAA